MVKKLFGLILLASTSLSFAQEVVSMDPQWEAVKGSCTFIRIYHREKPVVLVDKKPLPVYSPGPGESIAFLALDLQDRRTELFLEVILKEEKYEYILPLKTPNHRTRMIRVPYRKRKYLSSNKKRVHIYQEEPAAPAEEEGDSASGEEEDLASEQEEKQNQEIFFSGAFRIPIENMTEKRARFGDYRLMKRGKRVLKTYFHKGEDFPAPRGTKVYAAQDGIVLQADRFFAGGNTVIVDHGWGIQSEYLHLSKFLVSPGQKITKGQVIGEVGNTGISTGPHLHWGVRINGVSVNPLEWTSTLIAEIFSKPALAQKENPSPSLSLRP